MDDGTIRTVKLLVSELGMMALMAPGEKILCKIALTRAIRLAFTVNAIDQEIAFAIFNYSLIMRQEGDILKAKKYALITEGLCKKLDQMDSKRPYHSKLGTSIVNTSVVQTLRPFHERLDGFLVCHKKALKIGDTEYASLSAMGYCLTYLNVGLRLDGLEVDLRSFNQDARQFGVAPSVSAMLQMLHQTVLNLQKPQNEGSSSFLCGDAMNQNYLLKSLEGQGRSMTIRDINILQLMLSCIFWELDEINAALDFLDTYPRTDFLIPRFHIRRVYTGLGAFALGREKKLKRFSKLGEEILKEVKADIRHSSMNDYPVLLMLEAEARPSMKSYTDAITACSRIGLIHHEAYMCERAGAFLLAQNELTKAGDFLAKAEARYNEWGAQAKVNQMHSEYGSILKDNSSPMNGLQKQNSSLRGRNGYIRHRSIQDEMNQSSQTSYIPLDLLSVKVSE
jgi:hypothetical protein